MKRHDKAEASETDPRTLGSKLDSKLATSGTPALGARQISDLTRRVESAIESNLRDAETGAARLAPNRFRVLFTYEETSNLSAEYMKEVGKELTSTVREYINNRRYSRPAIDVEVARDVLPRDRGEGGVQETLKDEQRVREDWRARPRRHHEPVQLYP